ncbi:site-specific DNA-methyltransferase [Sulfurimonas sp.]|jgi:adenine-specific DNA-methyltransferase|uniref:DNA-methyltransferase n=1 Tax=Sulfurimonas sp. TaxID=2022749 RepID=UPI0025E7A742|nr:site-specific DNA-methyltransferase [Sulfurimonas sp.]MCK9473980.1 site-specific DNA-methyltransferase [Sulfurimonas sp.]
MTLLLKNVKTQLAPYSLLSNISHTDNEVYLDKYTEILNYLREYIGEPYYAHNGFILYNSDNAEIMNKLESSEFKIDLTVTSPPYNIGKEYENNMPIEKYVSWCQKWIKSIYNITKENGSFWLNVGYLNVKNKGKAIPIAYLLWDKIDFFLMQEIVWKYGAGVTAKKFFAPRNEKFLFYIKNENDYIFNLDSVRDPDVKYPNQMKNGKLRCNPLGKNPTDVWDFPKVTSGKNRSSKERTSHPAQYPLSVIDRIIKVSSNKFDIIFDPFSGSGTTGIAANGNYRIYIGSEISKDYCDLSIERYEEYLKERSSKLVYH